MIPTCIVGQCGRGRDDRCVCVWVRERERERERECWVVWLEKFVIGVFMFGGERRIIYYVDGTIIVTNID